MLYGLALQDRWPTLPANALSTPHPQIDLPPSGNQQLMVEPYIHVARSALPRPLPPPPSQAEVAACIGSRAYFLVRLLALALLAIVDCCSLFWQWYVGSHVFLAASTACHQLLLVPAITCCLTVWLQCQT